MRWYGGNISGAIAQAREQNKIMLVYIAGSNDDSKKMDEVWEEEAVMVACNETGVIAMRFQADSPESQQFSAYYPVICVPCVYLISGATGILLESIAGYKPSADLIKKIRDVSTSEAAPPDVKSSETVAAVAEQGASPPPSTSSSAAEPVKESAHERAARMRQKMEEVHRKKEQQKKEAEKQREMERRKTGQEIQKADKHRAEQQARQLAEEIRKQRQDDKVAREKVLQQLARDKAEKEARFRSEKEQREKQKQRAQQEQEEAQRAEQAKRDASLMEIARIQFRLPDGSTLTKQFSSSAPLQEALDFVSENVGASLPEFTLSTTYPRRNFGPSDMQLSFSSLELVPRAAIVVLPGRLTPTSGQGPSQVATSEEGGIFSWFLAPFLFIYNLIMNFFYGSAEPAGGPTSPSSSTSASSSQSSAYTDSPADRLSRTAGARPKSSYARRRTPASGSGRDSFSRREGNIHRLNTQQQDDDDNNTWNGNSTQQM